MDWMPSRRDPSQWMHPDDRKSDEDWEREEQEHREFLRDSEPSPSWFFPPYEKDTTNDQPE